MFPDFRSSKTLAQKLKTELAKCSSWFVVEPTPLKNMLVKLDHSPRVRVENKKSLSCHQVVFIRMFLCLGPLFVWVVLNGAGLACLWCVSWKDAKGGPFCPHQFFVVDYLITSYPWNKKTQGLLPWNFNTTFKKLFFSWKQRIETYPQRPKLSPSVIW